MRKYIKMIKHRWQAERDWLAKPGVMRDIAYAVGTGLFIGTVATLNILVIPKVFAVEPYTASNEIGQTDASHTTPNLTTNDINNVPQINKIGLDNPQRIALDSVHHRLFVADTYNSRVLVYNLDSTNHFTGQPASNALGQPGFSTNTPITPYSQTDGLTDFGRGFNWGCDFISPTASSICGPQGVAYDSVNNRLFVSDTLTNRVLVFNLSGGITDGMAAVHVLGASNLTTNDSAHCNEDSPPGPSSTNMCNPQGLTYDSGSQTLFVADSETDRVLDFDLSGGITDGMAAVHELGWPSFSDGPVGFPHNVDPSISMFGRASDVAYDPVHKYLYVADAGGGIFNFNTGGANRVLVFDLSGGITDGMDSTYVLGQGNFTNSGCGGGSTGMCNPEGLAYDTGSSTLFVSDTNTNRVLTFDMSGGVSSTMSATHVLGQADLNSNANANCATEPYTAQNHVCEPVGLAYDSTNSKLFVMGSADNRGVTYDLSGGISNGANATSEIGQTDYTGANSYALSAANNQNPGPYGLNDPTTETMDYVHHRLFVTDFGNQRILVYNTSSNGTPLDRTADYVIGQPNFSSRDPDCDSPGDTQSTICTPADLAYDPVHNRLFVGEVHRILVFDLSGGITNGMAASHVLGQTDFTSNSCLPISRSTFCGIQNNLNPGYLFITYDSTDDYLFVTDTGNNRVLAYDLSGGITDGMDASWVIGQSNFTDNSSYQGGTISATGLSDPLSLSFDNVHDRLFVMDNDGGRALVYNIGNGISTNMAADNVLGPSNFTSTGGLHMLGMTFDDTSQTLFGKSSTGFRDQIGFDEFNLSGGITNGLSDDNAKYLISCVSQYENLVNHGQTPASFVTNNCLDTENGNYPSMVGMLFNAGTGQFILPDGANNRVMYFDITPTILTDQLSFGHITNPLADGTVGTAYSQPILYTDVFGTPNFTVVSGSLPAGLSIDANTGIISGTPTSSGQVSFGLTLKDNLTNQTTTATIQLQIDPVYVPPPGPGYLASDVIGQPDFTSNGTDYQIPGSAPLYPAGSAIDTTNHLLFISDSSGSRVLVYRLNNDNTPSTSSAIFVLGQTDLSGLDCNQDGSASADTLCTPGELALDSVNHRLIVSDSGNNRVLIYNLNSDNTPTDGTADYVLGQPDFSTIDCTTGSDGECYPNGVALDTVNHHLYVSDANNSRVLIYNLNSDNTPTDGTADYVLGQTDFDSNNCDTSADTLCYPYGQVAIDSANHELYVSDNENSRVLIYNLNSDNTPTDGTADYVLGQTDFDSGGCDTTSADTLCSPNGLVLDTANHHLFVAEYGNNRVVEYNLNSANVPADGTADDVIGQTDLDSSDCNDLCSVQTITLDTANHRLVAGGWSNSGYVVFYNLNGSNAPTDDVVDYTLQPSDSVVGASGLSNPSASAIDTVHHRLFVGDTNRVLVFNLDANNNLTSKIAAYVIGQSSFAVSDCNSGLNGLCTIYSEQSSPLGLAYDSTNNRLFVADGINNRVMVFDLSGGITDGMDAVHELGQADFDSNDNCATVNKATLCEPTALVYDSAHQRLFVASNNERVSIYNLSGGITDGMDASNELGQASFSDEDCDVGQSSLCEPTGLDYDSANQRLFVADTGNDRVMIYDLSGGISDGMDANYEFGQAGFDDNSCDSAAQDNLCIPNALVYDQSQQRLLVSDTNNTRVMIFNVNPANITSGEDALALLGQADYNSNGTATTQSNLTFGFSFQSNTNMAYDSANHRLYLPDDGNNRIMIYNFARITTTTISNAAVGSAYSQAIDETGSQGTVGYSLQGGALPPGVVLAADTGTLSGTPTTAGTYNFALGLADDNGLLGTYNDNKAYSLTVVGAGTTPPPATPPSTPPATPPATPPSTPPTTPPVDLDNNPPVTTPDVCSGVTSASAGQVFTFTESDGTKHTITVLEVGTDTVVLQVDNLPKTLHVGDLISQDINGDGRPDVCVDVLNISNGIVELDIAKIILAIAPGGQTNSGSGAGNTPAAAKAAKHHTPPPILKFIFPWLLFILLGATFLRLSYLSWQQRRLSVELTNRLNQAKALSEEKQNFITLSSHYLRTPMTLISNGIDLMASLQGNTTDIDDLKIFSQQLSLSVNNLLIINSAQVPAAAESGQAGGLMAKFQPLAAGFAQAGASVLIAAGLAFGVIVIVLSNYILSRIDLQNLNLILVMTELAALLFMTVVIFASLRSYHQRKELRLRAELQLEQQLALDKHRDGLIQSSLETLKTPLAQLKAKIQPMAAANPKLAGPVLEGVRSLENLVGKFTILNSLKTSTMGTQNQTVDLGQLLDQTSTRYASALSARGLTINNQLGVTKLNQDPLLASFVLESLVNNAIKYSPSNQPITVSSHKRGKRVLVEVKDNGPAIPQDKLKQLFQPFSRAENAAANFDQKGIGLSLYLDKIITQYLGGTIDMQSGPQGTTARFSLPGAK